MTGSGHCKNLSIRSFAGHAVALGHFATSSAQSFLAMNLTDYMIDRSKLGRQLATWYALIADAYQCLSPSPGRRLRWRSPEPAFSDSEVVTAVLIIETLFHAHTDLGVAGEVGWL